MDESIQTDPSVEPEVEQAAEPPEPPKPRKRRLWLVGPILALVALVLVVLGPIAYYLAAKPWKEIGSDLRYCLTALLVLFVLGAINSFATVKPIHKDLSSYKDWLGVAGALAVLGLWFAALRACAMDLAHAAPLVGLPYRAYAVFTLGYGMYKLNRIYPVMAGFVQVATGVVTGMVETKDQPIEHLSSVLAIAGVALIANGLKDMREGWEEGDPLAWHVVNGWRRLTGQKPLPKYGEELA